MNALAPISDSPTLNYSDLRQVAPIDIKDLAPNVPTSGPPIIEWVDPTSLYIDETYQRDISPRGRKLIDKIIQNWDWAKFKPPITCFEEIDGKTILKVLDGQHSAIAAASHPTIKQIPTVIVEAPDTASQANSFVSHNADRTAVTNLQLHKAALAAGSETALTVHQTCERAGVRILKQPPGNGLYRIGDTVAVQQVYSLVNKRFAIGARQVLEILVKAECTPISVSQIKACESLLFDDEYKGKVTAEDLIETIKGGHMVDGDEAKKTAYQFKQTLWSALAMVWFKKCRKRRKSTKGLDE